MLPTGARPTLEDLVSRVTAENVHPEVDWGAPAGGELAWEPESAWREETGPQGAQDRPGESF